MSQRLLEYSTLEIRPVQYRYVFRILPRPHPVRYLPDYGLCLLYVRICLPYLYLLTDFPLRKDVLRYTIDILGDQAVRRRDYRLCRPVVLLELEHLAIGIVFLEVQYVLYPRTPETIYALRVITDDTDVPVRLRQHVHYGILHPVGVLILVN